MRTKWECCSTSVSALHCTSVQFRSVPFGASISTRLGLWRRAMPLLPPPLLQSLCLCLGCCLCQRQRQQRLRRQQKPQQQQQPQHESIGVRRQRSCNSRSFPSESAISRKKTPFERGFNLQSFETIYGSSTESFQD